MRVLLADRHPKTRSALRLLLSEEPYITLIGDTARDMEDVFVQAVVRQPEVVLIDWEMAGRPVELIAALRRLDLPPHVIVLSIYPELEASVLEASADVFISKTDAPDRLLGALRAVHASRGREQADREGERRQAQGSTSI